MFLFLFLNIANVFNIYIVKKEQTKNENNVEINLDHNNGLENLKKINNVTSVLGNMLSGPVCPILKVSVAFCTYVIIINNNFINIIYADYNNFIVMNL